MVRILTAVLLCCAAAGCQRVELEEEYHAVVLDNNSVYFARVENFGSSHLVLRDVYYLQSQPGGEGQSASNVLVRRGREWHGPNRMIVDARHVVFLEPVTAGSRVAELIAADRKSH